MNVHAALLDPQRRDELLDALVDGPRAAPTLAGLALVIVAGAGLYGAALGLWHGGSMVLYAAVKLPLVLIATSALTMVLNWMLGLLLGLPLGLGRVAVLSFLVLAVAAVVLASLAPVAWLFTVSAPVPAAAERTAHNLLYLFHTLFVGGAGVTGMTVLRRALARLAGERRARRIFVAWLLAFALVGGEVAWALRPFVGSVYHEVRFLRDDALDGNVYELILTDILPHLLGRDPEGD